MASSQNAESHQAVVSDLERHIRGPLFQPGDPEFDDARSVWNAMIDRRPALILRCTGVEDVVAGINAARVHGLPLSIKGGGHNIAGLAVCEGGLMLDMSQLRGVQVDPARRVARAEPGCLLGDVDRETQAHGLAAVLGFVSATGCAGLTLGGDSGTSHAGSAGPATTWRRSSSSPLTVVSFVPQKTRTASCSGDCAVAAGTSVLPRASSTSCTRSVRRSSPVPLPGVEKRRGACWSSTDRS
jgi:hypothetical protein